MSIQHVRRERPAAASAPQLDTTQQSVVDHPGGPLLVLAGPGTGKTTTVVELVADRVRRRGLDPSQALVLTFSRQAAAEVRGRIASRLDSSAVVDTMTFHSFCYALVRRFAPAESFVLPVQLMTAPEQDAVLGDLLAGVDPRQWPERLRPALRTRGFAAELRTLWSTLGTHDLGTDDLRDLAGRVGQPDWSAAAAFLEEYSQVVALQNASDYTDIVVQAVRLLRDPHVRDQLRQQYRLVVVDEYQDTDPLQVQLLHHLAGDGRDLVVVGDPDQSIYAFRGADVRGILDFAGRFDATTIALGTTRRFGSAILDASRAVVQKLGLPGSLPPDVQRAFRDLTSVSDHPGTVHVQTFASATAEGEHIAQLLREAHLSADPDAAVAWSDMAVLVRTSAELNRLERVLVAHGVPVEVAGDEIALAAESSVRALLAAVRVALHVAADEPVPADEALALLTGPIGCLDAADLRRVGRHLRALDADRPGGPRSSHDLLADAVARPADTVWQADHPATQDALDRLHRVALAVARAARQVHDRDAPEQVLWTLYTATDWQARLVAASESTDASALRAHRDLDALVALFSQAARAEESGAQRTVQSLVDQLQAQQIPGDTLSEVGVRGTAVRLMTAHRSKGLEWSLVVVAGVQDGAWPAIRPGGTVLRTERIGPTDVAGDDRVAAGPGTAAQLADERRLFYVACTRARRHLVVTAVASPDDDGDQPSRFVTEIAQHATSGDIARPLARPRQPFDLRGVVAELRRLAEDSPDPVVRDGAARRLAALADRDLRATRAAHPDRWWGVRDLTQNVVPVRDPDQPVKLSGSAVAGLTACSLQWFLSREVRGETGTTTAQGFGSLVHAIAADVVRRQADADPAALDAVLDGAWRRLDFAAAWIGDRERAEAHRALARFAAWHNARLRTPLFAERQFEVTVPIGDDTVVIRGSMDRVEVAADGAVHVVDLKTGKHAPRPADVAVDPQLGVYQLAIQHGALDADLIDARVGGAELVQLRHGADLPKIQPQGPPPTDEPFFALDQVAASLRTVRAERWTATPSDAACKYCAFQAACPAKAAGATTVGVREVDA